MNSFGQILLVILHHRRIRYLLRIFEDLLDFLADFHHSFGEVFHIDADVRLAVHHHVRLLRPCVDLRRAAERCDRRVIADMNVRFLREEVDVRCAGDAEFAAVALDRIDRSRCSKIGIVLRRQEHHRLRCEGGQRHVKLILEALRLAGNDLLYARTQGQCARDNIRNAQGELRRVSNVVVHIKTRTLLRKGAQIVDQLAELLHIVLDLRLFLCGKLLHLLYVVDEIRRPAVYLHQIVKESLDAVIVLMAVRTDIHHACPDIRVALHLVPVLVRRILGTVRHVDLCFVVDHADKSGCVRKDFRLFVILRIDHAALRRHMHIRHIVFRHELDQLGHGHLVRDADIRRLADVERRRVLLDAYGDARAEREHLRQPFQHAALFLRLACIQLVLKLVLAVLQSSLQTIRFDRAVLGFFGLHLLGRRIRSDSCVARGHVVAHRRVVRSADDIALGSDSAVHVQCRIALIREICDRRRAEGRDVRLHRRRNVDAVCSNRLHLHIVVRAADARCRPERYMRVVVSRRCGDGGIDERFRAHGSLRAVCICFHHESIRGLRVHIDAPRRFQCAVDGDVRLAVRAAVSDGSAGDIRDLRPLSRRARSCLLLLRLEFGFYHLRVDARSRRLYDVLRLALRRDGKRGIRGVCRICLLRIRICAAQCTSGQHRLLTDGNVRFRTHVAVNGIDLQHVGDRRDLRQGFAHVTERLDIARNIRQRRAVIEAVVRICRSRGDLDLVRIDLAVELDVRFRVDNLPEGIVDGADGGL